MNYENSCLLLRANKEASLGGLTGAMVKSPPTSAGDTKDAGSIPQLGRSSGKGMATRPSILAWRIPWTEEPGGLRSIGSQTVGHD